MKISRKAAQNFNSRKIKISSLLVLTLFLMSLVPFAIAEESGSQDRTEINGETKTESNTAETRTEIKIIDGEKIRFRTEIKDSDGPIKVNVRSRLDAKNGTATTKEELRARFQANREELKERLRILDPEKLRRLQALDKVAIDKIAGFNKSQVEKIAMLSRARQAQLTGMNKIEIQGKLKEIRIKQVKNADDLRERVLSRQKIEIAKKKFEEAREKYENAREKYQEARQRYSDAKESGNEEAYLEHAKEVLLRAADSIIGHLEKIKAKIEENEHISEENAANIMERI